MKQVTKYKGCLIGLGVITKRYFTGLSETDFLELSAVADTNERALTRELYSNRRFYRDYKEMVENEKPDYVIISTPPASHFDIARWCLEKNVNVIIEKPVVLSLEEFDALRDLAKDKALVFRTLFHWQGGIETLAFGKKYDVSKITEIKISVSDPYSNDGVTVNQDRRPLCGAWIDSGVNALSMVRMWLPFEKVEILDVESQKCIETGLPIYVRARLIIDGVKTEIDVDWRHGLDCKKSTIILGDRCVHIDHSKQSITDEDTVEYGRMQRLDEHYKTLMSNLDKGSNADVSRSVHKILYEVNKLL